MEYISILDLEPVNSKEFISTEFVYDLNLNPIIDRISKLWGREVKHFYGYFPQSPEAVQYRRDVYREIESRNLGDMLERAWETYDGCLRLAQERERSKQPMRQAMLYVSELSLYCDAVHMLHEGLTGKPFASEGFRRISEALDAYVAGEPFQALSQQTAWIRERMAKARFTMTYENKRIVLAEKECPATYESTLSRLCSDHMTALESPFSESDELEGLELELIEIFRRKEPDLFRRIGAMFKGQKNMQEEWIALFFREIPFYLSFMRLERTLAQKGAAFVLPTEQEEEIIRGDGLYDLALFIANTDRGGSVVSNDFYYDKDELFYVLTGPNQGGKTTFARSLGQFIFFGKMGLKVPAKTANIHFFTHLLTHFSVEESVETGRGKLMEELVRLAPMMKGAGRNSFVIINELFTTAANYDACIMGKKVLKHFIDRECYGIYVTHLSELLEAQDRAVGLCARLDDKGVQTFKIERAIMEYKNCAANQVEKYGLTYEKLKERLG